MTNDTSDFDAREMRRASMSTPRLALEVLFLFAKVCVSYAKLAINMLILGVAVTGRDFSLWINGRGRS